MPEYQIADQASFFASCPRSVEQLLAEELVGFDARIVKTTLAGVYFQASLATAYRACLWSRLANRIVLCLVQVSAVERPEALQAAVRDVNWSRHLPFDATLAVDFRGQSSHVRHTRYGAQLVKDGIVDALRNAGRERPRVELRDPDLRLAAHLHQGRLMVGVDLSGSSLHQRGYRREPGHAPLKENLAAALLLRAGWPERARRGEPLIDPLCGSGTLLIEAALMAADVAPNLGRSRFGFHGWAGHDESLWRELRREAEARASLGRRRVKSSLYGFDQSPQALAAAKGNAMRAGIPALIEFHGGAVAGLKRPTGCEGLGLLITNPPYGERIGELPELVPLYAALGEQARRQFPGWTLALFTGNPDLGHRTGLRAHKQYAFKNGPLDCKLLLIDVAERHASETPVEEAVVAEPARSEGAKMFANRLEKNRRRLNKWLKRSGEQCYRLYDADMPEYALAIDIYGERIHVQEYAPPRSVNADQAQRRLLDALSVIPTVLDVHPERVYLKQRKRQSGRAQYEKRAESGERFQVREGRALFWVNLRDYLDTGLFLDHRPVRRRLASMAEGKRFLNLFCYTATATVQAALGQDKGGASNSVSVDLSNTYLQWARENLVLNGLDSERHRLVRADCLHWLETAEETFDLIFLDPPTFSNSKKMDATLDVQRDQVRLLELAMARLAPGGTLLFSTNQRHFRLDEVLRQRYAVEDISEQTFDPDFQRRSNLHHCFSIHHREGSCHN